MKKLLLIILLAVPMFAQQSNNSNSNPDFYKRVTSTSGEEKSIRTFSISSSTNKRFSIECPNDICETIPLVDFFTQLVLLNNEEVDKLLNKNKLKVYSPICVERFPREKCEKEK